LVRFALEILVLGVVLSVVGVDWRFVALLLGDVLEVAKFFV
jgi:hypothetical protein